MMLSTAALSVALPLLLSLSTGAPPTKAPASKKTTILELDALYHRGQRQFLKRNYPAALDSMQQYLNAAVHTQHKRDRIIWVMDQVGRIYLRARQDVDGAYQFFATVVKWPQLTDDESDTVQGWLADVRMLRKEQALQKDMRKADDLYREGQRFYKRGLGEAKTPYDDAGKVYFHIAASYFAPFLMRFDSDPRVGEVLVAMGDIRRRSWTDSQYWAGNHYLREAIRRFPNTPIAARAFAILEDDIEFGYSGSGGTQLPPSVRRGLQSLRRLAKVRGGS